MKRYILGCMTVAVVFGGLLASARADDLNPPPWTRNQPNTTTENWTFSTSANPSAPDPGYWDPNGTPQATITGTGNQWFALYDTHVGVWTLGGANSSMDLGIPNTPFDDTKIKLVWTQITWEPTYTGEPAPVVVVNGIQSAPVTTYPVGTGSWLQSYYMTTLQYNPQYEDVVITGSYALDEVVVDTICTPVPEPSSLALLAVGALSLLSIASRKRRLAA